MGNHSVGRAFHAAFKAIDKRIDTMPIDELTEFMDSIGNEYLNTDAEFDDYLDISYPLGRAIIRVFNPNLPPRPDINNEKEFEIWSDLHYETVYKPFKIKYKFW